jgi:hypothetical protein
MGKSSGAVAAFTMAWLHPEQYRRVLTFNGNGCGPVIRCNHVL